MELLKTSELSFSDTGPNFVDPTKWSYPMNTTTSSDMNNYRIVLCGHQRSPGGTQHNNINCPTDQASPTAPRPEGTSPLTPPLPLL